MLSSREHPVYDIFTYVLGHDTNTNSRAPSGQESWQGRGFDACRPPAHRNVGYTTSDFRRVRNNSYDLKINEAYVELMY